MSNFNILFLKYVHYEQFKSFLDSLDEERKSWSLDLQHHFKNDKEYYEGVSKNNTPYSIVYLDGEEIIGFCGAYTRDVNHKMIEVSFVVKKNYQGRGIGTMLLKRVEVDAKKLSLNHIVAKHYKDNIASHKAFLKAGYKELKTPPDNIHDWKIKEINGISFLDTYNE